MIHNSLACNCCGIKSTKNRTINSGHSLCNRDNMELVVSGSLRLNDDVVLRIVEQKGDFKIVKAFSEPAKDYWEMRAELKLHAQMDNQSMVGWDCHESY